MPVVCETCLTQFPSNYELARHRNRKTPCKAKDVECPECKHKFTTPRALKAHIKDGRCKGKTDAMLAENLAEENFKLKNQLEQQSQLMNMANQATATAAYQTINNIQNIETQKVVVNVQSLQVTNSIGEENLRHLSGLSAPELRQKLLVRHDPEALALWCELTRADEAHPENHNALLQSEDSSHMTCCRGGTWVVEEKDKILLELARCDVTRFYNLLGRLEDDEAKNFRLEYVLHNVMSKCHNGTGDAFEMRSIMQAIAKPIMKLTNKYYVEPAETEPMSTQQVELRNQIDIMEESLTKERLLREQFEAERRAAILAMRRNLSATVGQHA